MAHPNTHIREAIKYAEEHGWRFEKASARAHNYGMLYCRCDPARVTVKRCTRRPRVPEHHARRIREAVDACNH